LNTLYWYSYKLIVDLINREEQEAENVKEDGEKTKALNRVEGVQEQIKAESQQLEEAIKKSEELEKTLQTQRGEQERLAEEEKKIKHDNKHALPKVR
jgi:hypothetical protein